MKILSLHVCCIDILANVLILQVNDGETALIVKQC